MVLVGMAEYEGVRNTLHSSVLHSAAPAVVLG